ncbi:transketolase family protein [Gallibacter intestinalis]|uniref:Transketolase family protein n=1 Tax=Gallibacter intestinalis TaxID=2779356 RepID=A0ABR9QYL6_9FIRM|nr:transketolase family protein [Gallibacter intestinalis]MBE5035938.1 transketolase family protein [Gallibacter intestinalis]
MADKIATRESYGKVLVEMGAKKSDLVVMDADLSGSTKTGEFKKVYPERFFNAGIAEQNLYAMAAGIALSGKTVCASTFAMFASGRAFEIIRNSIGYTGANVKVCATHAGITVGEDGASHQTFEDLALMRTIPGMTVVNPCDDVSARKLLTQVIEMQGPAYVRLGRAAVPVFYDEDVKLEIGKGHKLKDGKDITIIATGIMVNEAMKAAEILEKDGLDVRVIDIHTIKPVDKDIIIEAARETRGIITAEEHSVIGGLGSAVAEVTSMYAPCKVIRVGQMDTFGESGKPTELMAKYGMDADEIVKKAREEFL